MRLSLVCLFVVFLSDFCIAKPIGKVAFHAKGEGLALDINGEGGILEADLLRNGTKLSGTFTVKIKDFKTGIELRDEHLHKLLETDKYPIAKFVLTECEAKSGMISGTMEMHGKVVPISWPAKFDGNKVSIAGKLKLTDFGIVPPEYKLAKVNNEISIVVDLTL